MNALNFHFRQRRSAGLPDLPRKTGKLRLGDLLIRDGALRPDQVAETLRLQTGVEAPLGEIIADRGMLSRNAITRALARMHDTSTVDLARDRPDPRLAELVTPADCLRYQVIPWQRRGGITVLACTSLDQAAPLARQLSETAGPIRFVVANRDALHHAIAAMHGRALAALSETHTPLHQSCRDWSGKRMLGVVIVLAMLAVAMLATAPALLGAVLFWTATATLLVNTALKAVCVVISLRKAAAPSSFRHLSTSTPSKLPKISILVPLFKEANVAANLIKRLDRIDYPAPLLELCLVVEADDMLTRRAVRDATLPDGMKVITVPTGLLKTKPRAMNYALDFTSGSIIGVYDAEDAPDRDQLTRVAAKFRRADPKLACIQGVLSFYNPRAGWLARCFTFEYAGWFRVMLPGLQALGFAIPLGGTTLFFRRDALIRLGRWDAHNVTEDADLGMRLARHGYRCEMLDTITGEEANNRFWPWVRQRSRWLKGYAMTYCVHMRNPLVLWRDLGPRQFVGFQILFLGTLLAFCLAPVLWWTAAHFLSGGRVPAVAGLSGGHMSSLSMLFLACEAVTLSLFLVAGCKLDHRPALAWIFTLPVYFMLGTLAAYKGVAEMTWKPFFWDKTEHGVSPAEAPASKIAGGVDLEPDLIRDGKVVFQRLGRGDSIPRLDRADNRVVLVQSNRAAPVSRQRGRGQQRHRAVNEV